MFKLFRLTTTPTPREMTLRKLHESQRELVGAKVAALKANSDVEMLQAAISMFQSDLENWGNPHNPPQQLAAHTGVQDDNHRKAHQGSESKG